MCIIKINFRQLFLKKIFSFFESARENIKESNETKNMSEDTEDKKYEEAEKAEGK